LRLHVVEVKYFGELRRSLLLLECERAITIAAIATTPIITAVFVCMPATVRALCVAVCVTVGLAAVSPVSVGSVGIDVEV